MGKNYKAFVNWSNHPYDTWDSAQLAAAKEFGLLEYVPFPDVPPSSTTHEIISLANALVEDFIKKYPDPQSVVTMVQGEMTLLYHLLKQLEVKGYRVVAATSRRDTVLLPDGKELKTFKFNGFRDYF